MTDQEKTVKDESTLAANVVGINEKPVRRGRPKKEVDPNAPAPEPKPAKLRPAELYEAIFNAIIESNVNTLPAFHQKISVVEFKRGCKAEIAITEEGECEVISAEFICDAIMDYTRSLSVYQKNYAFTAAQCEAAQAYWRSASKSIRMPPHIRFKSDLGLCWRRIPFDPYLGSTPLFNDLFKRMSFNGKQLKAWIGSLFFPESYDQQYVWIKGEGNDGKSSIMWFLDQVFGHTALCVTVTPGEDKHWAVEWLDKRIAYFPDFEDQRSLKKGILKQITGGDKVTVRPMYRIGYHKKLDAKCIFSSNQYPDSELRKSDKRRLIFIEMIETEITPDARYRDNLWREAPAFIYDCLEAYKELCPNHGMIKTEEESYDGLEERRDRLDVEDYQSWFNYFFVKDEKAECTPDEIWDAIQLRFGGKEDSRRGAYKFLERKGFKSTQAGKFVDGKRPRVYKGLRRTNLREQQANSDPDRIPKTK